MNYTTFQAAVRRELEETTAGVFDNQDILDWTNDAADEIAREAKVLTDEVYANSVASQRTYDMADYSLEPIAVWYNGKPLIRETMEEWKEWGSTALTATGTPSRYAYSNDTLYLRPIPVSASEIRYYRYKLPTPIASVTSTVTMPFNSKYDRTIKDYVKMQAFRKVSDWESARMYEDIYLRGLDRLRVQEEAERSSDLDNTGPRDTYL